LDNLETVKIAPTVKTIKADAFSYNAALKTLYIPSSVTAIGQGTTYQSNNLKTVYGGWDTVSGLLTAIGATAYNDSLKAADYVPMSNAEMNPEIPEIEVKPSGPAATETIQISPIFGGIENYGGITYLLSNYVSSNDAYIVANLKNGNFTMKLTITDEDTGITYFIDKYFFDVNGNEFYDTWFFRFALGHYGITLENHKYTLKMDIYFGEDLLYTGTSEKGAYVSSQDDFIKNGAITPEKIPHTSTNDAPAQSGDAAIYATIAIAVAAVALAVVFKKRTTI